MSTLKNIMLSGLASLFLAFAAHAQGTSDSAFTSFGISGGISMPIGDWAKSRVAPSVNFFGMGMAFQADLELRIGRRWTLALAGGYTDLSGSDWEDYVASKGENVTVSAYSVHFAVLLRPHILLTRPNILRIELGPALLLASGGETYQGRAYTYDFLKESAFGVRAGLEYTRLLTDDIGVTAQAGVIVFPSGIEYVDGMTRTILSLPVTIGIRFLF